MRVAKTSAASKHLYNKGYVMKFINKCHLYCCILSALSFSATAQIYEFTPSKDILHDEPIKQGWVNDITGDGEGEAIKDKKRTEWHVDGDDGKASWKITPTTEINTQAANYGWTLSTKMRVTEGGYFTNYYANGQYRFLPIISLDGDNLIVEFEGIEGHTVLATGRKAQKYHRYDIVYHPGNNPSASFYFNDKLIKKNWAPTASTQNQISWGNGSSLIDGEAYYRSVNFTISGDPVFSSPDRIPSLVVSSETPGTVVIFAEKRIGGSDPGSIHNTNDIVTRTSRDYGQTWSNEFNLTEQINLSDDYDFSDPRPIYLPDEDKISLSYVRWPTDAAQNGDQIKYWMDSGVFYSTYDVEKDHWSAPFDVSENIKEKTFQIVGWTGHEYYSRSSNLIKTDSWELNSKLKIYGGSANDLSVSNGDKLFKTSFSITADNKLVVHIDDSPIAHILRENGANIAGFIDISVRYDEKESQAQLYIDDNYITDIQGINSTESNILFGQTSAEVDGRIHISNVKLTKNGQTTIEYDAEKLALINPSEQNTSPEALGWTKSQSGRAYNFYGVASVNPGPGHGIQLKNQTDEAGDNNERLIYPAITLDKYFLNVSSVFSDDKGITWDVGTALPIPYRWLPNRLETLEPSEADLVELNNGDLLLTSRLDFNTTVNDINYGPRHQFISKDGGITWKMPENYGISQFPNISSAAVDASITRFVEDDDTNYLLFVNPIGSIPGNAGRENLGLWFSFDEGISWKGPVQLVKGGSAYSDIYQLDSKNAMVIVEDNGPKIRTLTVPITKLKQLVNAVE